MVTPLCNRPPESLAPSIFSNPQEILYAPSYLNFPSPLMSPCIILSCPHIILFGEGQKFQNTPKTAMPSNKFWSPLVLSLSPDQNWIYPLIKFIPGDLLQRGVWLWTLSDSRVHSLAKSTGQSFSDFKLYAAVKLRWLREKSFPQIEVGRGTVREKLIFFNIIEKSKAICKFGETFSIWFYGNSIFKMFNQYLPFNS